MSEAHTGQIVRIIINGTMPSPVAGAIATHVVFVGEYARIAYYLYWIQGKIHGISPALPQHQFSLPCQPTSTNHLAGYDLSRAQFVKIVFEGHDQIRLRDHILTST